MPNAFSVSNIYRRALNVTENLERGWAGNSSKGEVAVPECIQAL